MPISAWRALAAFLAGTLLSGGSMLVRGDYLGRAAASEVEDRLNKRIEEYAEAIHRDQDRIERQLDTMRERLDEILARLPER